MLTNQAIKSNSPSLAVAIDGSVNVQRLIDGLRAVGLELTQDGKGNLVIVGQQGAER